MSAAADALRATLDAMAQPLREMVSTYETEIERLENELREAKANRQEALRALHAVDPNARPERRKPGPKTRGRDSNTWQVRPETREKVETWLRKTYPDEPFSAGGAARQKDAPGAPETIRRTMMALQDEGLLRLDSVAAQGQKFYRFTAAGG